MSLRFRPLSASSRDLPLDPKPQGHGDGAVGSSVWMWHCTNAQQGSSLEAPGSSLHRIWGDVRMGQNRGPSCRVTEYGEWTHLDKPLLSPGSYQTSPLNSSGLELPASEGTQSLPSSLVRALTLLVRSPGPWVQQPGCKSQSVFIALEITVSALVKWKSKVLTYCDED